jgi:hypothetical protein
MPTFAPKKKFRKALYTIETGFLLSPQCENSHKKKNIDTKGFWGKNIAKMGILIWRK